MCSFLNRVKARPQFSNVLAAALLKARRFSLLPGFRPGLVALPPLVALIQVDCLSCSKMVSGDLMILTLKPLLDMSSVASAAVM